MKKRKAYLALSIGNEHPQFNLNPPLAVGVTYQVSEIKSNSPLPPQNNIDVSDHAIKSCLPHVEADKLNMIYKLQGTNNMLIHPCSYKAGFSIKAF